MNQLVSTIDELAELVPPDAMPEELRRGRRAGPPATRSSPWSTSTCRTRTAAPPRLRPEPVDDSEGLRDFSARTVELRRAAGYRIAAEKLAGYL